MPDSGALLPDAGYPAVADIVGDFLELARRAKEAAESEAPPEL
jgi:hypothetical protein